VSAAGPAMNLLFLVAIALVIRIAAPGEALLGGLAFLAFLQATAFILNLLPVPGLDGFGIIQSLFPENERAAMASIGRFVSLAFFVVIISAPQVLRPLLDAAQPHAAACHRLRTQPRNPCAAGGGFCGRTVGHLSLSFGQQNGS